MLDRWVVGAIVLLVLVCLGSAHVALHAWLPDREQRARIRIERVERMLREVPDSADLVDSVDSAESQLGD
jgi:hypothetical protein